MKPSPSFVVKPIQADCSNCRIAEFCLSGHLPPEAALELAHHVVDCRRVRRGTRLYHQGDKVGEIYVVKAGTLKSCFLASDGSELIDGFHHRGDVIGLQDLHAGRHACGLEVLESATLCAIPYEVVQRLVARHPGVLGEIIAQRNSDFQMRLRILHCHSASERVAVFLLALARHQREHGLQAADLNLAMSRSEIASFLGLASETVSRALTQMQREGLVRLAGRNVHLVDIEGIEHAGMREAAPRAPRRAAAAGVPLTKPMAALRRAQPVLHPRPLAAP